MIRSVRRETYRKELRHDFVVWAEHNYPEQAGAIADLVAALIKHENPNLDGDTLDNKVTKDILKKSRFGLTDQEIASFEESSELFAKFMEEEGFNYAYSTPRYIVKEPRKYYKDGKLDLNMMSKKATADERNNMLIDSIWGVLTSPAGSVLSMMPGSYNNVKHSSRQQRILHDAQALQMFLKDKTIQEKLQKITGNKEYKVTVDNLWESLNLLSMKDLDTFYEENATIQNPMDILDYVDNHRNLMDGNDLIGMFAVNSSNHYKFQFLNLKIKSKHRFKINGVEIEAIDAVKSPITGVRIGRMCAEFQAASPDNGKDPCLGDLNANSDTVSRISFLLRIGLDAQTIGMLNTSDQLVSFGKALGSNSSLKLKNNKVNNFNLDIARITKYFADYSLLGEEGFINKYDYDDFQYLKDYSEWMKNIDDLSKELSTASAVSRSDSPNGALGISIAETTQQRLQAEDFVKLTKSPDAMIEGLDELIDIDLDATTTDKDELRDKILKSKIPRLQAVYTLGHKSAITLSKKWLVQMDDNVFNLVKMLRNETKHTLTYRKNIPLLKKFYSELIMYALSADSIFSSDVDGKTLMEKRNYYLHDFPMKLKQYLEEKDENGEYKHKNVRQLNIIQRLSNSSEKGILFRNVGKTTPQARKHYVEELESMLNLGPEEAKLAFDLFMYAYYDSGLSFRHNSYGIFFTTAFMRAMPRYINKLQEANNRLQSDPQFATDFVYQFMLNHPEIIPEIKSDNYTKIDKNTIKIIKNQNGFLPDAIMSGIDSLGGPLKLILIGNSVYKLDEGNAQTSLTYTRVTKIPEGTLFYDASKSFEEIEYDELQKRGAVTSIPKQSQKNKNNMKKAKDKEINTSDVIKDKEEISNNDVPQEAASNKDQAKIENTDIPQEQDLITDPNLKDEDIPTSEVPRDINEPNDDELKAQADALDAIERAKEILERNIKNVAKSISNADLNQLDVPTENGPTEKDSKDLNNMDSGQTNLCKGK